jgi:hypothetical protein
MPSLRHGLACLGVSGIRLFLLSGRYRRYIRRQGTSQFTVFPGIETLTMSTTSNIPGQAVAHDRLAAELAGASR